MGTIQRPHGQTKSTPFQHTFDRTTLHRVIGGQWDEKEYYGGEHDLNGDGKETLEELRTLLKTLGRSKRQSSSEGETIETITRCTIPDDERAMQLIAATPKKVPTSSHTSNDGPNSST